MNQLDPMVNPHFLRNKNHRTFFYSYSDSSYKKRHDKTGAKRVFYFSEDFSSAPGMQGLSSMCSVPTQLGSKSNDGENQQQQQR